jgi:hypothetical protein
MPVSHYIKITTAAGTNPVFVTQSPSGNDPTKGPFGNLAYSNVLNGYGICSFTLNGDHVALATLVPGALVEVWREWPELGVTSYREWSGIYLDESSSIDENNGDIFQATCVGDQYWLSTASIAWPAGTVDRSIFASTYGEDIMKFLVLTNVGVDALATNGRDRDHVISGLDSEGGVGHGNSLDWACANENLLNNLQKLAQVAGGDFDLIKTGPAAWEFRWYTGQRGTDRSASVKFSVELGNMASPRYSNVRSGEKTVALVKGQGVEIYRASAIRTGVNYNASTNNNEMYVNASSQATTAATLNAAGDAALKSSQAVETIAFDALPFPNSVYGKHWFLGDKVTVKYKGHTLTPRVVMVTTTLDVNKGEIITPGMAVNV